MVRWATLGGKRYETVIDAPYGTNSILHLSYTHFKLMNRKE